MKRLHQAIRRHAVTTEESVDTIESLLDQQYLINAWTGRYSRTEFVARLRVAFAAEASRGGA